MCTDNTEVALTRTEVSIYCEKFLETSPKKIEGHTNTERRIYSGCLNSRLKAIILSEMVVEQYFTVALCIW